MFSTTALNIFMLIISLDLSLMILLTFYNFNQQKSKCLDIIVQSTFLLHIKQINEFIIITCIRLQTVIDTHLSMALSC